MQTKTDRDDGSRTERPPSPVRYRMRITTEVPHRWTVPGVVQDGRRWVRVLTQPFGDMLCYASRIRFAGLLCSY